MTRSELLARIYVFLGGRVAEEMIFGDVSTGAQNDLQKATEIARTMVTQFGMSDRLGLVALEGQRTADFLACGEQPSKEYSEETARIVDEEIKRLLTEAHQKFVIFCPPARMRSKSLGNCSLKRKSLKDPRCKDPEYQGGARKDSERWQMQRGQSASEVAGPIGKPA